LTDDLVASLNQQDGVLNLVELRGSSRHPVGDTLQFDVLNGAANSVFAELRQRGIVEDGSIQVDTVEAWLSESGDRAAGRQARFQVFTPVWELVDARIRSDGLYPPSWYVLLVIAGIIGAVGLLTNSQILIVAAMVVGPEYGAITSVARAANKRDGATAGRGLLALLIGFSAAVVAALALGACIRAAGLTPRAFALGVRPVSSLINTPNAFSVIVAVVAGIVGILSLTESRTATLIGVFISVTTIPAAADIGLSMSYGSWAEARGSLIQLLINVGILVVVGMVMLVVQKRIWDRVTPVDLPAIPPS